MKVVSLFIVLLFLFSCNQKQVSKVEDPQAYDYALVIHGGAGNFDAELLGEEGQHAYAAALDSALNIGEKVLKNSGTAADAVVAVISYLEDNPLFNAGKGAVFTHEGTNELDASIMQGSDLNAGAVAGVKRIKNPIVAARMVMEKSPHVMMASDGAEAFVVEEGLPLVEPAYFYTEKSYQRLQKALREDKHGTVGCVALDRNGNLVAGTSTGGMTNKRYGRIGDSPVIGAGTYANNQTCGVSCTGHGEYFIRYAVAHDISALMEYKGLTVDEAAREVVMDKLVKAGGEGGVVCLDHLGRPAMIFNTTGMFRAYTNSEGEREVAMFAEND
jgi:beta-aspartyl-peptidase (threonine type)